MIKRNPSESLNEYLRRVRESEGISQAAWAKAAGVDQGQISRWENGKGEPGIDNLKGMAARVGITLAALVGDEQPIKAPPRHPSAEEFAVAFLEGYKIDPRRKALAVLALSAEPEILDSMYGALKPWLAPIEHSAADHKKPSAR